METPKYHNNGRAEYVHTKFPSGTIPYICRHELVLLYLGSKLLNYPN